MVVIVLSRPRSNFHIDWKTRSHAFEPRQKYHYEFRRQWHCPNPLYYAILWESMPVLAPCRFGSCCKITIRKTKQVHAHRYRVTFRVTFSLDNLCYDTSFNTLRPRRNEQHFADDIFKRIFFNENVWISIKISLKFVPKGPVNSIPALIQILAWRRSGDKPLSEPTMVNLPTQICVTRPQWVNDVL